MNKTAYKNKFNREHYDRIHLAVPKGMKSIFKSLASQKGMSVNAYVISLVQQDKMSMINSMKEESSEKESF